MLEEHMNEIYFVITTCLGMVGHYLKKYLKGETEVSMRQWFGSAGIKSSILSIGAAIMVAITALSNNIITPEMTFWGVVYIGLTTGIAVDSSTNSDGTITTKGS